MERFLRPRFLYAVWLRLRRLWLWQPFRFGIGLRRLWVRRSRRPGLRLRRIRARWRGLRPQSLAAKFARLSLGLLRRVQQSVLRFERLDAVQLLPACLPGLPRF